MDREFELLRAFATRTAEFSSSPDETRAVRNLYLAGLFKSESRSGGGGLDALPTDPSRVGIWQRENAAQDGAFERSAERRDDWSNWANLERIEPKRGKWRVVFLGESAARGYFYDPAFTPAAVLEGMLKSHLGAANIDVVDLAKTNLRLQELKFVVGESPTLRPDVVVIFAGNNWRTHLTEPDIPYVDSLLRQDGVPGMKSFLASRVEESVRQLTRQVNQFLGERDVPVIWVVPEFNLDDWADPASNAPRLTRRSNAEWRDLGEQASMAFRAGDLGLAETLGKRMVELDGGTNWRPLRILAECCRSKRDLRGTRRYLEMCRDAGGWDPSFPYSPRVSSSIQTALRDAASSPQNAVVDLPEILSGHLNAPADRRMFLDYCHLTADGINVAMAAVASKILEMVTDRAIAPQTLHGGAPSPAPKVEGKACFLAAIHSAHYHQSYDLVHYWCARALRFWPECAQIMTRFADFQTRRTPTMACKSMIELAELGETDLLRYLTHSRRLDMVLGDAIAESVAAIGMNIEKDMPALRVAEHSTKSGPKDLTDFYYCSTLAGTSEPTWTSRSFPNNRGSRAIYASAFWETSKFIFFSEKGRGVTLKFTYRVPTVSVSDATVQIDVNGYRVTEVTVDRTWQTREIAVPADCVVDGVNEIAVTWPNEDDDSAVALGRLADTLVARRLPYFYRVYGEIHTLVAFDSAEVQLGALVGSEPSLVED